MPQGDAHKHKQRLRSQSTGEEGEAGRDKGLVGGEGGWEEGGERVWRAMPIKAPLPLRGLSPRLGRSLRCASRVLSKRQKQKQTKRGWGRGLPLRRNQKSKEREGGGQEERRMRRSGAGKGGATGGRENTKQKGAPPPAAGALALSGLLLNLAHRCCFFAAAARPQPAPRRSIGGREVGGWGGARSQIRGGSGWSVGARARRTRARAKTGSQKTNSKSTALSLSLKRKRAPRGR